MKKVVITGAMGFIGSHTAKVFKQAGYQVIGVDRTATLPEAAQYIDQLFQDDFVEITPLAAVVNEVDAIIHCAGTSLVGPSLTDPGEYYNNNSAKTNLMMDKLSKLNYQGKIIFSSSAATYGIPLESGNIPEDGAKNPISPYGWSKLFCEYIIKDHCLAHNMRGIALRYFNACGCDPDTTLGHVADDSHMIPRVLAAYHNDKPFTLYGNDYATPDGTCIRDYLHVMDIAWAHLEAVCLAETMSQAEFCAYNLGTGQGYSNREIIAACERAVKDFVGVTVGARRTGDPDRLVANSDRFQKDTAWRPRYSDIDTIVETAWRWQQRYPNKLG